MVQYMGPQPRLMNFFSKVCSVNGKPIKANQEMVLRSVWMDKEIQETILLSIVSPKGLPSYKPKGRDAKHHETKQHAQRHAHTYKHTHPHNTRTPTNTQTHTHTHTHQVLKDPKNSRQRLLIPKTLGLTSLVVTFSLRTDLRAQQCLYVGTDVLSGKSVTWKTLITVRHRHHQIRHPFLMRHWTQLLVHLCQYCRMFRPW